MTTPHTIDVPRPLEAVEVVARPASARPAGWAGGPADPTMAEMQAGIEEERKRLTRARQAMEAAAQAIQALEADLVADVEDQLVDLALSIAQKVVMQEIENGRYQVQPLVREALGHLPSRKDLVVHLNPEDLAQWQQAAPGSEATPANLRLVADGSVRRAECVVETAEGTVSATVADRLREAAKTLKAPE